MKNYILVLIAIFSFQFCNSQIDSKKLHQNLESISKKTILPGFSITIIKNDSVYFQNGYGFADKTAKKKYTIETIQPIASISKTFIGFSIMKSIDLGYFTLETDINTILPFKITNPSFPNSVITIKDLATHTSSLIDNEATAMSLYSLGEKPSMELSYFLKEYYTIEGKFYSTMEASGVRFGSYLIKLFNIDGDKLTSECLAMLKAEGFIFS